MWKLAIEDDEGKRVVLPLTLEEYSIGRKDGSSIRLTERNVSRAHARLYKKAGGKGEPEIVLEDLTSYNGVFVNGARLTHAQPLAHGDVVQIGDYRITLQDDRPTDAPALLPDDVKQTVPGVPNPRAQLARANRLVMLAGPTPGSEHPLEGERLTIGRAEEAAISVNHNSVSRIHCEVHALDDGRYEIVDKESSNGVRVNGTDLRRGIVEPGDVIELGDVQFKFVAAGQVFRPSQAPPLAALGNRDVADTVSTRRRSNALPIAVFAVVVAGGSLTAWLVTRRAPEPHAAPQAAALAPPSPEEAALEAAKALCAAGDCDGAHAKLAAAIAGSSPLRGSPELKDVETRWADGVLARAAAAAGSEAKRALYQQVSQDMAVDPARRKAAADELQELEAVSSAALPPPTPATATKPARTEETLAARPEAPRHAAAADAPAAAPQPAPAPPARGSGGTDERERQLALQGTPEAKMLLKQQIEQRVAQGAASEIEIRLLVSTCKDLGDRACVQSARAALAKLQSP